MTEDTTIAHDFNHGEQAKTRISHMFPVPPSVAPDVDYVPNKRLLKEFIADVLLARVNVW